MTDSLTIEKIELIDGLVGKTSENNRELPAG